MSCMSYLTRSNLAQLLRGCTVQTQNQILAWHPGKAIENSLYNAYIVHPLNLILLHSASYMKSKNIFPPSIFSPIAIQWRQGIQAWQVTASSRQNDIVEHYLNIVITEKNNDQPPLTSTVGPGLWNVQMCEPLNLCIWLVSFTVSTSYFFKETTD